MKLDPRKYYSKREVGDEIASFLRNRWAAVEGKVGNEKVFARYLEGEPLWIRSYDDLLKVLEKYPWTRTLYGTISVYENKPLDKLKGITLFWDLDCEYELGPCLKAAKRIGLFLRRSGVEPWIKFSGKGFHVHVNEGCFDWKAVENPFEIARKVEAYVVHKLRRELEDLELSGLKVEMLVDPARVTTAPLSLHRELDRVAVAMRLDGLDQFDVSWADPNNPKHDADSWRMCEGSLEALIEEALRWSPPRPSKK